MYITVTDFIYCRMAYKAAIEEMERVFEETHNELDFEELPSGGKKKKSEAP